MALQRILALLSLWLGVVFAYEDPHFHKRSTSSGVKKPSLDPWYTAPKSWKDTEPGTVLRVRQAPGNLTSITGNSSAAYNILYRTTDSQYKPTWAVTTLLVPELGPKSVSSLVFHQAALLSYQVPYDSADVDASPSYSIYSTSETSAYGAALGLGLFVSIPDYEGPLASFTAGVISGHATLDSVRAVLSLGLGLNTTSPKVALWGYSGGALASEWASELALAYAPELSGTIVGAALGGLTPNITSVLESISGTNAAGLAPSSIIGISSQYPDVQKYIFSLLKTSGPYNKTGFLAARDYTLAEAGAAYVGVDIGDYFIHGTESLTQDPKILKIVNRDGIMGYHGVPQWPLFVYKTVKDEISKIQDTDELVKKYCGIGANILYQRNSVGTHSQDAVYSLAAAVEWLSVVLTGRYAEVYKTEGCTIQNVTRNDTTNPLFKRGVRKDVPNGVFRLW
ncbi:secretory lipase-domain-containing protein [Dactylonectria macrodidyma]|uniref:Secretory lipase-domain-containing protein n=1 Tax=Dactylonectria macrodidyma TaxID=307937 RepID=A0A9P9F4N8_9HYPO|nr:secretory lipase-domain-containing protein [Dactylonectria macrodidyma]